MTPKGHRVSVEQSGLVVDSTTPCLACSPDGIVSVDGEKGLVELKCPYKAAKDDLTPVQAAKTFKDFFCRVTSPSKPEVIELKRLHN